MSGEDADDEPRPLLARRSPFTRSPKLCPRCLSPLSGVGGLGAWLVPQDYYCEACGYAGKAYVEKRPQEKDGS